MERINQTQRKANAIHKLLEKIKKDKVTYQIQQKPIAKISSIDRLLWL